MPSEGRKLTFFRLCDEGIRFAALDCFQNFLLDRGRKCFQVALEAQSEPDRKAGSVVEAPRGRLFIKHS